MNENKIAHTDHPVHELIARRWSPYAFSGKPVSEEDLSSLFEAARWAPSSYNEQPWSYIVATKRDRGAFESLLTCLVEGNQIWAREAPVLAIGCASLLLERNGKPNAAALHDLGLASAFLTFEASARGLHVHQMIGIVPDRVRELFGVPEKVQPLTGLAIGHLGSAERLPDSLRERDASTRTRKTTEQFVFGGSWGKSWSAT